MSETLHWATARWSQSSAFGVLVCTTFSDFNEH